MSHAYLPAATRFLGLDDRRADPERARVVVVPVPYERTSSFGRGAAAGPGAILEASHQVELHDMELGHEPWSRSGGIVTLEPLRVDDCADGETMSRRLDGVVGELLRAGKRVVTLAGEHTGVVGAIHAHARRMSPLTVLQLDAHSDLRDTYLGDRWNHACTMARVLDFHRDIVQVGIRSSSREDLELVERHDIPVIPAARIDRDSRDDVDWIAAIVERCSESVYVTLDCDVFDPSVMPATGTPEPGGLTWRQVDELLARLGRERRVVGFDLSELAPVPGLHFAEFGAAKLVYRLIGIMSPAD